MSPKSPKPAAKSAAKSDSAAPLTAISAPPTEKSLLGASLAAFVFLLLLYVAGALWPASFLWGVHQLAFLGTGVQVALLLAAAALALPAVSALYVPKLESFLRPGSVRSSAVLGLLLLGGALGGIICYRFRISTDMYGDSRTLLTLLAGRTYTFADIFTTALTEDALREPLTRLVHQAVARFFGIDQKLAFQIVSSACGALFFAGFPYAVLSLRGSPVWKLLLLVTGLTCGANQLFFGHVEDYTLFYLFIFAFLVLGWKFFDGVDTFPILVAIFLVGTRLHVGMVLFLPALVYLFFCRRAKTHPGMKRLIRPRAVLFLLGLTLVAGTLVYFFILHADRLVDGGQKERGEKMFLPLFNPLLSPHSYTLLSLSHASDIVQEILLTVAPGAVVLLLLGARFGRHVRWSDPRTLFFGLSAFYSLLFVGTVNPLLTPERDWDLLSLVAAPLLFFAIALSAEWFERLRDSSFPRIAIGISLALGLLSCSIFYVNSQPERAGARLRSLGVWAFDSYYLGSAYLLNVGARHLSDRRAEIAERKRAIELLERSKSNPDLELGFLDHKLADALYLDERYPEARQYYMKALREDPYNASAIRALTGVSLQTGNIEAASEFIGYYNDNVNGEEVVDPEGLQISERINYLRYLEFAGADTSLISGALAELRLTPRQ